MTCPNCQSEDWKAARLVHMEGMSQIRTSTATGGIGISKNGVGAGAAASRTSGEQQSATSLATTPPTAPGKYKAGIGFWIVAFILSIMVSEKTGFPGLLILVGAYYLIWPNFEAESRKAHEDAVQKYQDELATWEATRMCQRCGTLYLPEQYLNNGLTTHSTSPTQKPSTPVNSNVSDVDS